VLRHLLWAVPLYVEDVLNTAISAVCKCPLGLTIGEHRLREMKNKLVRRIFVPKRGEVVGGWRRLHNEELRNLYASTDIIMIIKSRGMRWLHGRDEKCK
jgi:hypothetical protein